MRILKELLTPMIGWYFAIKWQFFNSINTARVIWQYIAVEQSDLLKSDMDVEIA